MDDLGAECRGQACEAGQRSQNILAAESFSFAVHGLIFLIFYNEVGVLPADVYCVSQQLPPSL